MASNYLQQWFTEDKQNEVSELNLLVFWIYNFCIKESTMDTRCSSSAMA
jgi:hypothetical protein